MTRSNRTVSRSIAVATLTLLMASSLVAQKGRRVRAPQPVPADAPAAPAEQPAEAAAAPAKSDAPPKLPTPKGSFELVEWVVFVVDAHRPNANEAAAFKSTVPGFARGR